MMFKRYWPASIKPLGIFFAREFRHNATDFVAAVESSIIGSLLERFIWLDSDYT